MTHAQITLESLVEAKNNANDALTKWYQSGTQARKSMKSDKELKRAWHEAQRKIEEWIKANAK
jgi:phosphatidate phosphatase APP1